MTIPPVKVVICLFLIFGCQVGLWAQPKPRKQATPTASANKGVTTSKTIKRLRGAAVLLQPGTTTNGLITNGQMQSHKLELGSGQFLQLFVRQCGVDLQVRLFDPQNRLVAETNAITKETGTEWLSWITEKKGEYRVEVKPASSTKDGKYEVLLSPPVSVGDKQRTFLLAEQEYRRALALLQGKKVKLRAAKALAEKSYELLQPFASELQPPDLAILRLLIDLYLLSADYRKAGELFQEVRPALRRFNGADEEALELAAALGQLLIAAGKITEAEELLQVAAQLPATDGEHRAQAMGAVIEALGDLCLARGQWEKALGYYQKAAQASPQKGERNFVREQLRFALTHFLKDEPQAALRYLDTVTPLGQKNPTLPHTLLGLGKTLQARAGAEPDVTKAQHLYESARLAFLRALQFYYKPGKTTDDDERRPEVAEVLFDLAVLNHTRWERLRGTDKTLPKSLRADAERFHDEAKRLYNDALKIRRKKLSPHHPQVVESLVGLAKFEFAEGDTKRALKHFTTCLSIAETGWRQAQPTSENTLAKIDALQLLSSIANEAINWGIQAQAPRIDSKPLPGSAEADKQWLISLAYDAHLRNKGRALEYQAKLLEHARGHLDTRGQLALQDQQLLAETVQILLEQGGMASNLTPEQQLQYQKLEERLKDIQAALSLHLPEWQTIPLPKLQAAFPSGTVFVDYFVYESSQARSKHFGAFLISNQKLQLVDLGPLATLNEHLASWQMTMNEWTSQGPKWNETEVKRRARLLYDVVFAKIRPLLPPPSDTNRLVISPEGALNYVSFESLTTPENRYLVQDYSISYVTSAYDLLRLIEQRSQASANPQNALSALVITNPAFGPTSPSALTRCLLPALGKGTPGLKAQTTHLKQIMKNARVDARVYTGTQATEQVLKQAKKPTILHIATHAYLLEEETVPLPDAPETMLLGKYGNAAFPKGLEEFDDAVMLRSGLALSGYNQCKNGKDDGVLTAREMAGLQNLAGTKLAMLSACETGLSEFNNGNEVYGFRRALALAGVESQVISLWRVEDMATERLVTSYYRNLLEQHKGRGESLRETQLQFIKDPKLRHPIFWAAFVLYGEWAKL